MDRNKFLTLFGFSSMAAYTAASGLRPLFEGGEVDSPMPVLFIGHGNPMNAITDNAFTQEWKKLGKSLPRPKAILVISAHWLTQGKTMVTAMENPRTIHDFGGFPDELFQAQYPAPGSPEWAAEVSKMLSEHHIGMDDQWGLDHGTWSVLMPMYPLADIPVFQLSMDYSESPEKHFQIGQQLMDLRKKGILIIGSGNVVHNLRKLSFSGEKFEWAEEFDAFIKKSVEERNFKAAVDFQNLGNLAKLAHPTYDHYLPLLYTLGLCSQKDEIRWFNDSFDMGSISMRSLMIG